MTDVADRHWGQSLVRAPTAKDAVQPGAPVTPGQGSAAGSTPEPAPRPQLVRGEPTLLRAQGARSTLAGTSPPAALSPLAAPSAPAPGATRPAAVGVAPASPPVLPPMPPMPPMPPVAALRHSPEAGPPPSTRMAQAAAVFQWPVAEPAEAMADPSLARLARGVQDCARALASLADRIDGLERRLDAATAGPGAVPSATGPHGETVDVRLRALEGMSADHLQGLDQRLRRLEALPTAVSRIQEDLVLLADVGRPRGPAGSGPDLAPVYEELDSVAELVTAHHGAATQSLERVRTLERAVLDMRRNLERNQAEHARVATSELTTARDRLDGLEARLAAAESTVRSIQP